VAQSLGPFLINSSLAADGENPDDPIFTIQLIDNTKSSEITIHGQTRQSRQSFRNRNS